jgi:hypothetical protein
MRSPDPAVVVCIYPIAISVEIFGAPEVVIVVLDVITKTLGQVALAIVNPVVP